MVYTTYFGEPQSYVLRRSIHQVWFDLLTHFIISEITIGWQSLDLVDFKLDIKLHDEDDAALASITWLRAWLRENNFNKIKQLYPIEMKEYGIRL